MYYKYFFTKTFFAVWLLVWSFPCRLQKMMQSFNPIFIFRYFEIYFIVCASSFLRHSKKILSLAYDLWQYNIWHIASLHTDLRYFQFQVTEYRLRIKSPTHVCLYLYWDHLVFCRFTIYHFVAFPPYQLGGFLFIIYEILCSWLFDWLNVSGKIVTWAILLLWSKALQQFQRTMSYYKIRNLQNIWTYNKTKSKSPPKYECKIWTEHLLLVKLKAGCC